MGNQVPPEYSAGCRWCEGVKWAVDEGPRYVLTTVSGVTKCPGAVPNAGDGNGSYLLEFHQQCGYGYSGPEYEVVWSPDNANSWLNVFNLLGAFFWFHGWAPGMCGSNFVNINHCPLDPTEGGSANPSPHDGPTGIFCNEYGFFPEPYYEYEKWDIGNKKYMFRINDGTGRVNILFKWDRQAKINI